MSTEKAVLMATTIADGEGGAHTEEHASFFAKLNVLWHKVHPAIIFVIHVLKLIHEDLGVPLVVTSVNDSTHLPDSDHYIGKAVDIRTHHLSETAKDTLLARVRHNLGSPFYVALEDRGGDNEHLHIGYKA